MRKGRGLAVSFLTLLFAACAAAGIAACSGKDEKDGAYGLGEEGVYYHDSSDESRYLLSLQSGTYMLSLEGDKRASGSYSYDGGVGEISFTDGGERLSAYLYGGVLTLDASGSDYVFMKYVYHDVTFAGFDGEETVRVLNGKSVERVDGASDGAYFLGWYADADFETEYDFSSPVLSDTYIYGRYVEKLPAAADFSVTYDFGDGTYETGLTVNGAVYALPSAEGLLGWWVSATNKSFELTHEYAEGDTLGEDTTLFAVYDGEDVLGASVTEDGVTWKNTLGAYVYVYVYDSGLETLLCTGSAAASAGHCLPENFSSLGTGTYRVVVTAGNASETLTYIVDGLKRASGFCVVSDRILAFSPVENATEYILYVSNGTDSAETSLGSDTYYDFSGWEMTSEGLTFRVTASAVGYVESVSDEYNVLLALGTPEVCVTGDVVYWNRVENALYYEVYVDGELAAVTYATSFSLKDYGVANLLVSVRAVTDGYYSERSEDVQYNKESVAAPSVTAISGYTVYWDEVEDASGYVVIIDGREVAEVFSGTETSYGIKEGDYAEGRETYKIAIRAVSDTADDSACSDVVVAYGESMGSAVSYKNGTLSWQYVLSAAYYGVSVNGSDEILTSSDSAKVILTRSGENAIVVTAYSEGGTAIGTASCSVEAFAVYLDARGGESETDAVYFAKGDALTLPGASLFGYEFSAWYTLPDYANLSPDGPLVYSGEGTKVENGVTVFDGAGDTVLYAYYEPLAFTLTLVATGDGCFVGEDGEIYYVCEMEVRYGKYYTLPGLTLENSGDVFYGWYTEEGRGGARFTDETGEAVGAWTYTADMTLYSGYASIVVLTLTASVNTGEPMYSASKGEDAGTVTEITVPSEHGGIKVGMLPANAFSGCEKLEVINIPDTVEVIISDNNGYSGTGAFSGCGNLKYVNIYSADDEYDSTREIYYFSEDGVLFYDNSTTGLLELVYYPQGRTESAYAVPANVFNEAEYAATGDGREVTGVATQVFTGKNVEEVTIPSTVTKIETQAFYRAEKLTKVTFADGEGTALTIDADAFASCPSLTEVTLPGRLEGFDAGIFTGDSALSDVFVAGSGNYSSRDGVLFNGTGSELVFYPYARDAFYEIPSGVTAIGERAFYENPCIVRVVIPSAVTRIGEYAFCRCDSLAEVDFEGNEDSQRLTVERCAFYGCRSLIELTLPQNLEGLGRSAFGDCANLKTVNFDSYYKATAEGLSGLEPYAFSTLSATKTDSCVEVLNLGKNVPAIGFAAIFGGERLLEVNIAEGNENFAVENGVVYDADVTAIMYFPRGYEGEYEVPPTVTEVASDAFSGISGLTKVTIPSSVTEIGENAFYGCVSLSSVVFEKSEDGEPLSVEDGAFYGCENLASVEFPARLAHVGENVFHGCTALEELSVEEGCGNYLSSCGALYEASGGVAVRLLACPTSCKYTTFVVISTVAGIENGVFYGNLTLEEIFFDGDVDEKFVIEEGAFSECASLKKVTLPGGLTQVPASAFSACPRLESVFVPSTVTYVGVSAFLNCTSLSGVIFEDGGEEALVFADGAAISKLDGESGAFCGCTALKSVTLPSLSVPGKSMFVYCTALESAYIGDSATEIPSYMFYDCNSLSFVNLPETLTSVDDYAFTRCFAIKSVALPKSVTKIGTYAFSACTSLSEFDPAGALETIGNRAFSSCESLTTLEFGDALKEIGTYCFLDCTSLQRIVFGAGLETVRDEAFKNCTSLEYIIIPQSVTYVGASAFDGVSCPVYVEASEAFAETNFSRSWKSDFKGTAYFYSEKEPALSADGTTYDGNFWRYDDNGNAAVWEL